MNSSGIDQSDIRTEILDFLKSDNIEFTTPLPFQDYNELDSNGMIFIISSQIKDKNKITNICQNAGYDCKVLNCGPESQLIFLYYNNYLGFILLQAESEINLDHKTLLLKRDSFFYDAIQKIKFELGERDLLNIINSLQIADTYTKSEKLGITKDEFYFKEYMAQFLEYKSLFYKMKNNNKPFNADEQYNHIHRFAYIYYIVIDTISKEIGFSENLTIHDAGTNTGFFSFLISVLTNEKTISIKEILATDLSSIIFYNIKNIVKYHIERQFKSYTQVLLADFTDDCSFIPTLDVTINIHVLEHMENEKTAKKVLNRLWEKTSKLLIVNVPLEEVPDKIWGHNISFSPEKLFEWSKDLHNGELISNKRILENGKTLLEEGFLIVKRKD